MPEVLDDNTRTQLGEILKELPETVKLVFFGQKPESPSCAQQRTILQEIAEVSDKVRVERYDFVKDRDKALEYGIDKIPATAVVTDRDYGIRFYGLTMGYEFSSLVEAMVLVSTGRSGLPEDFSALVGRIKQPVHIEVMTTLT